MAASSFFNKQPYSVSDSKESMYVSIFLMAGGVLGLIAGVMLIVKALFLRVKKRLASERPGPPPEFAELNKGRSETRLGLVLIGSGSVLALPEYLGLSLRPTTLTILAFLLIMFLTAYSRYTKQMRAAKPER